MKQKKYSNAFKVSAVLLGSWFGMSVYISSNNEESDVDGWAVAFIVISVILVILHWCGDCGNPGPYSGKCPQCESRRKVYNG